MVLGIICLSIQVNWEFIYFGCLVFGKGWGCLESDLSARELITWEIVELVMYYECC